MLDEMRALLSLHDAGSFARAAQVMHLTPSAVTRMVQRLESHLGAALLDRTVKPPRFTPLGLNVLQQCRELLVRFDQLASSADANAAPAGLLRMGLAHALGDESVARPVRALTERHAQVRVRLSTDLTSSLVQKVAQGELDCALVIMPVGQLPPAPLASWEVARDTMTIVGSAAWKLKGWSGLQGRAWVLNPAGCLLRAALVRELERNASPPEYVTEVHNVHLQAALVAAGQGMGLLPKRLIRRQPRRTLAALRPDGFELPMSVVFVEAAVLGRQAAASHFLRDAFADALN